MVMKKCGALTVGGVGIIAAFFVSAGTAQAANGHIGVREKVCAETLYLRTTPQPNGPGDGFLNRGESFLVESRSGVMVYGFAYGHINRKGWVHDGHFC